MNYIDLFIEVIFEDFHDNIMDSDLKIDIFSFFNDDVTKKVFITKAWFR